LPFFQILRAVECLHAYNFHFRQSMSGHDFLHSEAEGTLSFRIGLRTSPAAGLSPNVHYLVPAIPEVDRQP
jgi:hypothetical protein